MASCGGTDDSDKSRQSSPDSNESVTPTTPEEATPSARPVPRPSGDALLVATIRPAQLLDKAGDPGSLLDMARALPELTVPEVLAGLLRKPARLGIDLNQPVHLFVERDLEANATKPRFLCVTAGIADASVVSGHIEFFALLGMKKTIENELTFCQFAQPALAFAFDDKHLALVLAIEKGTGANAALGRLRSLFATPPQPNPVLDGHLARPFEAGLYLRPEGINLAPDFIGQGSVIKLPPSVTTTAIRFNDGEIIAHFERFASNKNGLSTDHPASTATLPTRSVEAGVSLALVFEDNSTARLAARTVNELLASSWPSPFEMSDDNATTLKHGQWLASWTGASSTEGGAFLAKISLAGDSGDGNSTVNVNTTDSHAELPGARFALEMDFPRTVALLRSVPDPEPWRYDFVTFGEKLERLSWSGDLFQSTLKLALRDKESNSLASLLSMTHQWQAERDGAELYAVIAKGDYEAFTGVMENASPDLFDPQTGVSPLHFAAWQGRARMLRHLIDKGIDVDAPDVNGRTPLYAACWSGMEETVKVLLDQNATIDAPNANGATPSMGAARIGHAGIVRTLLEAGADVNATDRHGHGLLEYASAGGRNAIVELLNERNTTVRRPLHVAAGIGDLNKTKQLLAEGREVDEKDGWGGTALLFAASAGELKTLDFLLDKGANPTTTDKLGLTLIHAATVSGNEKVLQRILELTPEINPRHKQHGSTPLDWASAKQDQVLTEMLRAKGGKTSWELGPPASNLTP